MFAGKEREKAGTSHKSQAHIHRARGALTARRQLLDEVGVLGEAVLDELLEREAARLGVEVDADLAHEALPVAVAQRRVAERLDERHRRAEVLDLALHELPDARLLELAQLHEALAVAARRLLHGPDVEAAEGASLPARPVRLPALDERPQRLELVELALDLADDGVVGRGDLEDIEAGRDGRLARAPARDAAAPRCELLLGLGEREVAGVGQVVARELPHLGQLRLEGRERVRDLALHGRLGALDGLVTRVERRGEGVPARLERREARDLALVDAHLELGEERVHLLERLEALQSEDGGGGVELRESRRAAPARTSSTEARSLRICLTSFMLRERPSSVVGVPVSALAASAMSEWRASSSRRALSLSRRVKWRTHCWQCSMRDALSSEWSTRMKRTAGAGAVGVRRT